jgi:hypothetical protein
MGKQSFQGAMGKKKSMCPMIRADFVLVGDCRSSDTSTCRRLHIWRRLLSIVNDFQVPSNTAQSRRVKGCSKTFTERTRDQEK